MQSKKTHILVLFAVIITMLIISVSFYNCYNRQKSVDTYIIKNMNSTLSSLAKTNIDTTYAMESTLKEINELIVYSYMIASLSPSEEAYISSDFFRAYDQYASDIRSGHIDYTEGLNNLKSDFDFMSKVIEDKFPDIYAGDDFKVKSRKDIDQCLIEIYFSNELTEFIRTEMNDSPAYRKLHELYK